MRWLLKVKSFALKYWFLCGIISVIVFAKCYPSFGKTGGVLKPETTVKWIGVSCIFLNSGLSLKTTELLHALSQARLHIFIQGFSLICSPIFFSLLCHILQGVGVDDWIVKGMLALGCLPPPVSSAVLLTRIAGGNQAAAIFNSALGSFLGVIVTPVLLLWVVGTSSSAPVGKILRQLLLTVVVPLVLGQTIRTRAHSPKLAALPFGSINSFILLLIIFNTFCDTFSNPDLEIDPADLALVLIIVVATLLCTTYIVFRVARLLPFSAPDVVAATFCATHKSLTLGIPVLQVVFQGERQLSLMTLPLLIYHPSQILIGSLLVPFISKWMLEENRKRGRFFREYI